MYVETTVPSYLTAWPSRDVVRAGEQQVTRDWWARRSEYELRVSSLVLLECRAGDQEAAALRLAALEGVPLLTQAPEAEELAATPAARGATAGAGRGRRAAHRGGSGKRSVLLGDLELYAYRQRVVTTADRGRVSAVGVRAAGDLHAAGTARRGGRAVRDADILTELRAWRDEFARSHDYDLHAMASSLRALDWAAGAQVVRGEPRRPSAVPPNGAVAPKP